LDEVQSLRSRLNALEGKPNKGQPEADTDHPAEKRTPM